MTLLYDGARSIQCREWELPDNTVPLWLCLLSISGAKPVWVYWFVFGANSFSAGK